MKGDDHALVFRMERELIERSKGLDIYRAGEGRIIEVRQTDDMTGYQRLVIAYMEAFTNAIEAYLTACEAEGFVFSDTLSRLGCTGTRAMARGDDGKRKPWTSELEAAHQAAVVEALRSFNKGAGDSQEETTHEEGYE